MNDNFNTLEVIAAAFGWFNFINTEISRKKTEYDLKRIANKIVELFGVLNILQQNPNEYVENKKTELLQRENISVADIEKYIAERATAKQNRDWATADAVRAKLLEHGIVLQDTPNGTKWDINL